MWKHHLSFSSSGKDQCSARGPRLLPESQSCLLHDDLRAAALAECWPTHQCFVQHPTEVLLHTLNTLANWILSPSFFLLLFIYFSKCVFTHYETHSLKYTLWGGHLAHECFGWLHSMSECLGLSPGSAPGLASCLCAPWAAQGGEPLPYM